MTQQTSGGLPIQLLRLVSPSQPVGSFSYSRSLEWAVHDRIVYDEASAAAWIFGLVEHSYSVCDAALFLRMMRAMKVGDRDAFLKADTWLSAARESREIELEDKQMGASMLKVLQDLGVSSAKSFKGSKLTYPAAFTLAATHWNISETDALRGLLWSTVEGQVSAAIRLVPLGHTAGQRLLIAADDVIERSARKAETVTDDEIGNAAPVMAMASAWHETQYSRLFRS
ncbi:MULTISPECIES: urease accessory protein UreF [Rhizobium/Agrobacterium group]|uniref:Urease accessory protein UreF n=1 Tax=Rhizobium rhizogenes TaxID=359 RepID=A0A546XB34_RHIRH|nr:MULTISPECIES: urease accessory protein UreF [Rhizobium/Agrobacterium group]TRA97962.1 urease accessory protein UreF [Rhizobium rhizogenes]